MDKIDERWNIRSFIAGFVFPADQTMMGPLCLPLKWLQGKNPATLKSITHSTYIIHLGANGNTCPANAECTVDVIRSRPGPTTAHQFRLSLRHQSLCGGAIAQYRVLHELYELQHFIHRQKTRMLASGPAPDRISRSNSMRNASNAPAISSKIDFEFSSDQANGNHGSVYGAVLIKIILIIWLSGTVRQYGNSYPKCSFWNSDRRFRF
jgi:hypothetical protein